MDLKLELYFLLKRIGAQKTCVGNTYAYAYTFGCITVLIELKLRTRTYRI